MNNKFDWFMDHLFGWIMAGIVAGVLGGFTSAIVTDSSKDALYVKCLYNMRDRTIDQLEMMCSHLKAK